MDEIKTVKRLVNLSTEEERELEEHEEEYMQLAKELISTYDRFENGKVKVGRLTTLHENIVYKINFSYKDLYKTAVELKTTFDGVAKDRAELNESLIKGVEDFLSRNGERKEFSS